MISLFRLHWKLVRMPAAALEENLRHWPVGLGIAITMLSSALSIILNATVANSMVEACSTLYGTTGATSAYFVMLLVWSTSALIHYYIYPPLVSRITKIPMDQFDVVTLRRILFFPPTANVIYSTLVLLPLMLISTLLVLDGFLSFLNVGVLAVFMIAQMWSLVLVVNQFVIQWKGLKKYFGLNALWSFLVVLIFPLILGSPLFIARWPQIVDVFRGNLR